MVDWDDECCFRCNSRTDNHVDGMEESDRKRDYHVDGNHGEGNHVVVGDCLDCVHDEDVHVEGIQEEGDSAKGDHDEDTHNSFQN